jgi:predicted N-acetyltransferase YhbS
MKIEYLADHHAHVPMVAAWQQAGFSYLNPSITLEERTEKLHRCLQKEVLPMTLIALSEEETPLGSASILPATITHQHLTPWLSAVYVPSQYRGRGVASALCQRAVTEVARLGYGKLYLFTPHNETLYARLGWRAFGRAEHNGLAIVLMERPLGATPE